MSGKFAHNKNRNSKNKNCIGYCSNDIQEQKLIANIPYINTEKDLQIFYNLSNNTDLPWGSSYKYTIPKSSEYNNSSSRKHEHFSIVDEIKNKKICLLILLIIIILILY